MRIVLAALSRPITVVVALIALALFAVLAVQRMPVDIFPKVGDPAIYVAQPYGGMDPAQMEGYLTYYYEYHFLYITGIDHVESKSIQGAALMKLIFHEGTDMAQAMAETVGYVNRARAFMPPGTVPPFITRFDAGSVAVGLLVFSSATHTQGELQDFALNRVRPLFATLPGVSAPPPFGGNQRTIVITLDPDKLRQYQISPEEAIAAVSKATLVMPSGNMWTGEINRIARTNAALGGNLSELLSTPIRPVSGATDLPARHRNHRERHRHHYGLRPRRRQANRLYSRHQARRCLDAGGHPRRQSGDPGFQEGRARRRGRQPAIRPVAVCHQLAARPDPRRPAGRGTDRLDGADLPARLAQRR